MISANLRSSVFADLPAMHCLLQKRSQPRRRGATLVEFALVAPLLFLLCIGGGEFIRLSMLRHDVQAAAYEAAALAALPGTSDEKVQEKAESLLLAAGIRNATTDISRSLELGDGRYVTVRFVAPLTGYSWFTPALRSRDYLQGVATLKSEWPPAPSPIDESRQSLDASVKTNSTLDFRFDAIY